MNDQMFKGEFYVRRWCFPNNAHPTCKLAKWQTTSRVWSAMLPM